jgi:hypothetical protein
MASVFSKLNLGSRTALTVLGAPASFDAVLATLDGATVRRSLRGEAPIEFALAFVTTQAQVNDLSARLSARMPGDALLWFAYPKQSSKRYRCEFNRDTGWAAVGAAGFEPVRQIAIDEDWSALRFRRVEYIKKLTRSETRVLSPAGRARTRE